jgi:hypothetical protein
MATQPADRSYAEAIPMFLQAVRLVRLRNWRTMEAYGRGEKATRMMYDDVDSSLFDLLEILGKMEEQGSADARFAIRDFMNSILE